MSLSDLPGELRARAGTLRASATTLTLAAESTEWSYAAAEAMRRRARTGAADLHHSADLHDRAAEAVERHLAALSSPVNAVKAAAQQVWHGLENLL